MTLDRLKAFLYPALVCFSVSIAISSLLEALLPGASLAIAEAAAPVLQAITAPGARLGVAAMQAGYNIVFILTDQERYFDAYPSGTDYRARERLKSIGTTFEKHYICTNMSTSSRSVIYTGKHIPDTKMFELTNFPYQNSMNPDIETIGDKMRSLGYYSAYKGKFHMMDEGNTDLQKQNALEPYGFSDWNPQGDLQGRPGEGYKEDPEIAAAAIGWLRSTGTKLNAEGTPFFLAVNLVNPHDIMYFNTDAPGESVQDNGSLFAPIQREPDSLIYKKTYDDPIPPTWDEGYENQVPAHGEFNKCWSRNTGKVPQKEENWKRFKDYYYNTIQDSDEQLEKILNDLSASGMMDRTIILMTSYHGELQGSHNLNGKGNNVYEYNTHVPLVIYSRFPPVTVSADGQLASDKRGIIRGLITAEGYKFARYFKPSGFNTPQTLDELFENNDVEIFDLNTDATRFRQTEPC